MDWFFSAATSLPSASFCSLVLDVVWMECLFDELFCLEEASQVENLPGGQANETAHGEDAEVKHTRVGRLWKQNSHHSEIVCIR